MARAARFRLVALFFGAVMIGAALVVALPRGGEATPEGPPAYRFSDYEIQYPYMKPGIVSGENVASVSMISHWANGEYPGYAEFCKVTFTNSAGEIVGSVPFGHDNATDGSPLDVEGKVSGEPAHAEAECGSSVYEGGPGYEKTGPAVISEASPPLEFEGEAFEDRAKVEIPVTSQGSFSPAMRECDFTAIKADGTSEAVGSFEVNLGPGDDVMTLELEYAPEDLRDVDFECRPL